MIDYNFTSDIVIGLEIHIEIDTKTKLFCACSTKADLPNTSTCEVCLGFPGSKPVLNKKVVDYAIMMALATNSKIAGELVFSRKNYFYPDMSKNYQITQYELPICENGSIELSNGKKINLTRIHIEEDPASLIHNGGTTLVDYNRSGRPLLEMVTEPELTSSEDARDFMKQLVNILQYIKIFDMTDGLIKADVNISIKESGYKRVEIKNVSGFKEIEKAIEYEVMRQKQCVINGEAIVLETRLWDGISTKHMRLKESESDYGYILDPDLVITDITDEWIEKVKESLPELPVQRAKRYVEELNINPEDAKVLTLEYELSEFFDNVAKRINPVIAARWVRRELARVLNYNKLEFHDIKFTHEHFSDVLELLEAKKITDNVAKKIIEQLVEEPFDVKEYVKKEGLEAVQDTGALETIIKEMIDANPKAIEEYKGGKENSLNFLVGQVMRQTRGAASAPEVIAIINKLIGN